jgi:amino acid transporter
MSDSKDSKPRASVEACQTSGSSEDVAQGNVADITAGSQCLHRSLRGKEVQLFAIGGAIGTCLSP